MNDDDRTTGRGWVNELRISSVPALLRAAHGTLQAAREPLIEVARVEGDLEYVKRMIDPLIEELEKRAEALDGMAAAPAWDVLPAMGNA